MSDSLPQKQKKKNSERKAKKIADLAVDLSQKQSIPEESQFLAFQAQVFTQASLPYRDPKEPAWVRTNGNYSLMLESGRSIDLKTGRADYMGLPFGSYPRLFLIWLTTEVLRTKKDSIDLGNSLMSFMEELGVNGRSGGKTGTRKRFVDQIEKLLTARITFAYQDEMRKSRVIQNFATKFTLWKNVIDPEQLDLFNSSIQLDPELYRRIMESAIPLDIRAVRAFQQSAFTLDLYSWLTYRIARQAKTGKTQNISWQSLHSQFGSEIKSIRKFRQSFKENLEVISFVYPRFGIAARVQESGLILHPENPSILTSNSKKLI